MLQSSSSFPDSLRFLFFSFSSSIRFHVISDLALSRTLVLAFVVWPFVFLPLSVGFASVVVLLLGICVRTDAFG